MLKTHLYRISAGEFWAETTDILSKIEEYKNVHWNDEAGLFEGATSDLTNSTFQSLAVALDSQFFRPPFKEMSIVFRGRAILGREVNYYFQGLLFRAFNYSKFTMHSVISAWKKTYWWKEEALHIASDNDFWAADLGFDEYDQSIAKHRREVEKFKRENPKRRYQVY